MAASSGGRAAPFPIGAVSSIAAAIFLNVTIETIPTGILLPMSADLEVPSSAIGLLVTVFAFTVVLSAVPLVAITRRIPRRILLVGLLLVFALSAALSAIAQDYVWLLASRILGGLAHGVFWAVAGSYAASLVRPEQLGRAVAITLGGVSLAMVLGVPLGMILERALGWRAVFGILAVAIVIGAVVIARLLPDIPRRAVPETPTTETGGIAVIAAREARRERAMGPVLLLGGVTAVTMAGHFAFYTYIVPYLEHRAGLLAVEVAPLLLAYGAMSVVALVLIGLWPGARARAVLPAALLLVLIALALLGTAGPTIPLVIGGMLLWGLAKGGLAPLLQTRVLTIAPSGRSDESSSIYVTGYNIGIGSGAWLGGLVLDSAGLAALPVAAMVLTLVALAALLLGERVTGRHRGTASGS